MTPELSILIAAHHEGLIAHKTMLSIERALAKLSDVRFEIIVTIDNGDDDTKTYFKNYQGLPVSVFEINDRDLAASRNFAIKKSKGKYIAIVDADDLVSEDWFKLSLEHLRQTKSYQVLHAKYSVNFGTQDILWEKFDSRSLSEDATIMVWANRWDSAIVTQRELLEKYSYQPNTAGFGSEDWHFNSETIAANIPHKVVDGTVLFIRRKDVSEMTIQATERRTVHYTNLLSFENLKEDVDYVTPYDPIRRPRNQALLYLAKDRAKIVLKSGFDPIHRLAKRNERYRRFVHSLHHKESGNANRLPSWLINEWREIHKIEKAIFPSRHLLETIPLYHSEMYDLGKMFRNIVRQFSAEPDYIIFVPSLNRGGAELVALNYISALRKVFPAWKIAVVATENLDHPWLDRLPSCVDYVEFGKHTEGISLDQKLTLMARLIVQSKARRLHIAQSSLMYQFSRLYNTLLSNYSVYAFAFCEDTDSEGRVAGQIHSGLPLAYPILTKIFSDNKYVIDRLVDEYAFDPRKFLTLYQPFNSALQNPVTHDRTRLKILWASRVSKQKRPDILIDIAKSLHPHDFSIDMYGLMQDGFMPEDFMGIRGLRYRGEFSSISELNLSDYDLFLYTSENDGIPNILLEATAAGLPIIAPFVGGIPELIGEESPVIVKHYEDVSEYVVAINKFRHLGPRGRSGLVANVQSTIQKQHNTKQFEEKIRKQLS